MASSGHGISDAVRGSIRTWMTDRVIDILYKEAQSRGLAGSGSKSSFASMLRSASMWTRISRKRSDKAGIWSRTYYSKMFGTKSSGITNVGLTVLTNPAKAGQPEDMVIEYVTITYAKKVIGGGKVSIPSVRLSQVGRRADIEGFTSESLFSEFTEVELNRLTAELEFGEDSVFALIEEERVA